MPEDFFDHCLEAQAGVLGLMLARQGDRVTFEEFAKTLQLFDAVYIDL